MQFFHCCVAVTVYQFRQYRDGVINILFNSRFNGGRGTFQYVIRHLAFVARMTHTESQTHEIANQVSSIASIKQAEVIVKQSEMIAGG